MLLRRIRRSLRPQCRRHPPGYLDSNWTTDSWTDQGVRDKVGAKHWPLPNLLHAFIDAGLMPERLFEGGTPVPTVLAVRARKN